MGKLKIIELFAGIGAQTQALKEAGIEHEVVAISEIDKFALKAYELLHGPVNNLGDIKNIERLPKADLWTYSFPCQDISLSGTLKGFEKNSNTKSSLLWEVGRLLDEASKTNSLPIFLLLENVKNLVSKKFINNFNEWLEILSNYGYKNFYKVLNAKDYGIPQNRERVFVVSILEKNIDFNFPQPIELEKKLLDFLEEEVDAKYFISEKMLNYFMDMTDRNGFIRGERFRPHLSDSKIAYTITTNTGSRATDNFILVPENTRKGFAIALEGDAIYIDRPHQKRGTVQQGKVPTLQCNGYNIGVIIKQNGLKVRRLTPKECMRLMGWEDINIDKLINKISDTQIYKLAGNSIVISQIKYIFKELCIFS